MSIQNSKKWHLNKASCSICPRKDSKNSKKNMEMGTRKSPKDSLVFKSITSSVTKE